MVKLEDESCSNCCQSVYFNLFEWRIRDVWYEVSSNGGTGLEDRGCDLQQIPRWGGVWVCSFVGGAAGWIELGWTRWRWWAGRGINVRYDTDCSWVSIQYQRWHKYVGGAVLGFGNFVNVKSASGSVFQTNWVWWRRIVVDAVSEYSYKLQLSWGKQFGGRRKGYDIWRVCMWMRWRWCVCKGVVCMTSVYDYAW